MISDADIMTLKEVAEYLRIHTTTVYRMIKRRKIPYFKIGADYKFMRSSIEGWLMEQEQHGSKQIE